MSRSWIIASTIMASIFWCPDNSSAQGPIRPAHEAAAAVEALGGQIIRTSDGDAEFIDMKGPQVRDEHLELLYSFPSVRVLNLDGSQVTDGGLEHLLNLPNLEEISVRGTPVSEAAAKSLKDRHPKVYFVQVDQKGLRLERLLLLVVVVPMGLWGIWLVRLTRRKRQILPAQIYARGVTWGMFLVVVSVILFVMCVVQTLGFDFHLSNLFD